MPISKKTRRTFCIAAIMGFGLPVLAVSILLLRLGPAIRLGVERVGPRLLGVETRLEDASVALWKGNIQLSGLKVANPEGFKNDTFLKADVIRVGANIAALRRNEIHVREIILVSPEITFERTAHGSNIGILLDRLRKDDRGGGDRDREDKKEGKEKAGEPPRLKVDLLRVTDARVRMVLFGNEVNATLPSLSMRGLQDADGNGLPMREVVRRFITSLADGVKGFADMSEDMERLADDLKKEFRNDSATRQGLGESAEKNLEKLPVK